MLTRNRAQIALVVMLVVFALAVCSAVSIAVYRFAVPSAKPVVMRIPVPVAPPVSEHHELSQEAMSLLLALADAPHGDMTVGDRPPAYNVKTNEATARDFKVWIDHKNFAADASAREVAKWRQAVDDLESLGFIRERASNANARHYLMTGRGYDYVDSHRK
jgi:hypothetical protein